MAGSWLLNEDDLLNLPFDQYVAAYIKANPDFMAGVRNGLRAVAEGRVRPLRTEGHGQCPTTRATRLGEGTNGVG
jgi:hypothetical protein